MEKSICDSVIYSAVVGPVHEAHKLLFHRQPHHSMCLIRSLCNVSVAWFLYAITKLHGLKPLFQDLKALKPFQLNGARVILFFHVEGTIYSPCFSPLKYVNYFV